MEEHVYPGRDNTIDLVLKADGEATNLDSVTKITALIGDTLIESEDHEAGPIMWGNAGYETGEIRLDLGDQGIAAGRYAASITVYDVENTNGIFWGYVTIVVH